MEEACVAIAVALATENSFVGEKRNEKNKEKNRIWSKEWLTKYMHHNLLNEVLTANTDYAYNRKLYSIVIII